MPDIKDSVGEGGSNQVHDVALLQAMLRTDSPLYLGFADCLREARLHAA